MSERYIETNASPYANGVNNLENSARFLYPTGVYARYLHMKGEDVIAICGTDEHGIITEVNAAKEGTRFQ
ncbi:MAG: class I tRNA ligase family protein [Candidatus Hodarchaeota archaeon]